MIDPKLDKLETKNPAEPRRTSESAGPRDERADRLKASSAGLSVNDTIARDANLSVGSRGVDVSGVKSGAGAGGGSTTLTPGARGESPAPRMVTDARGSGMTPRSTSGLTEDAPLDLSEEEDKINHGQISERAYRCWHERGCPHGSPEVDWDRAERELREERHQGRTASATA